MSLDITALTAVLKVQYTQKKVNTLSYTNNPLWAMLPKRTDFVGINKVVALRNANPQGRAYDFTSGLTNVSPSVYNKFTVTRAKDYAFGRVFGEAIEASAKDAGSLLAGLKAEIDGAMYTATRSLAKDLYGNGGGSRGQISAGSNVGTPTITLADTSQIVNFEPGMKLRVSATDGTSGSQRAGTVTVTAVDRVAGTITASGNWTAGIAAAAVTTTSSRTATSRPFPRPSRASLAGSRRRLRAPRSSSVSTAPAIRFASVASGTRPEAAGRSRRSSSRRQPSWFVKAASRPTCS